MHKVESAATGGYHGTFLRRATCTRCGSDKHKVEECKATMKLVLMPIDDDKVTGKEDRDPKAAMAEEVECELSAEESAYAAAEASFGPTWAPAEEFIDRAAAAKAVGGENGAKEVSFLVESKVEAANPVKSEGGGHPDGDSAAKKTAARRVAMQGAAALHAAVCGVAEQDSAKAWARSDEEDFEMYTNWLLQRQVTSAQLSHAPP
jgi:hypothetical protein